MTVHLHADIARGAVSQANVEHINPAKAREGPLFLRAYRVLAAVRLSIAFLPGLYKAPLQAGKQLFFSLPTLTGIRHKSLQVRS